MRRFWLFRSNLKSLEYYHAYKDLSSFILKCHDFYMLFPLWLLQKDYMDEVTIWRLSDKHIDPIVFSVNGKKYIQRWCKNFKETLNYPSPDISFWRGGFKEYDDITKTNPEHFGKKVYLGAGQRINAQWEGKYDLFLMEDDLDLKQNPHTKPFYKTASPYIFHPIRNSIVTVEWHICWPCNFTQLKYKGQELFIKSISKSKELKKIKVVHCGNKSDVGRKLCDYYEVNNIEFLGLKDREGLNEVLNHSMYGLNLSNRLDGCPRVSTEILMSGTPLIIHEQTRLMSYYKQKGVVEVNDENIEKKIMTAIKEDYYDFKSQLLDFIENEISFDNTCKKNVDVWF